jgi:hypothetical protein
VKPLSLTMMVMAVLTGSAAVARDALPQDQTESSISPVQALVLNGAHAPASEVAQNPEVNVREGQPLTAVVVTQCNLVVAVYFTMRDGKLIRFDKNAGSSIKAEDLVTLAYNSAARSERVEVGCDTQGLAATEPHSRTDLESASRAGCKARNLRARIARLQSSPNLLAHPRTDERGCHDCGWLGESRVDPPR